MRLIDYAAKCLLLMSFVIIWSSASFASNAELLVRKWATIYKLDPEFVLAVAKHESRISCGVIGSHGERGPLQILPATARGMGFGDIRRASCDIQTKAGVAHLKACYEGSGGNRWRAAACHNQGTAALGGKITRRAKLYADAVLGVHSNGLYRREPKRSTRTKRYLTNFGAG